MSNLYSTEKQSIESDYSDDCDSIINGDEEENLDSDLSEAEQDQEDDERIVKKLKLQRGGDCSQKSQGQKVKRNPFFISELLSEDKPKASGMSS